MALTADERRYWSGYFERKAAAQEAEEERDLVHKLRAEVRDLRKELARQEDAAPVEDDGPSGLLMFAAGCVLGLVIG